MAARIPLFLAGLVGMILVLCSLLWRQESDQETDPDNEWSTWLLLGLLLAGVFGLGAFLMYGLLHPG